MRKKITVNVFDFKSINNAIDELYKYELWIIEKTEELRVEVAKVLADYAEANFNGEIYDDLIYEGMTVPNVSIEIDNETDFSLVIANGEEAVFVEFGAGVYYNPGGSSHPSIPPQVKRIGTYGHGYGSRQIWGFYDNQGILHLTHGTPASMPMYNALQAVIRELPNIAKKVFGS